MRILLRKFLKKLLFILRHLCILILKYEMMAADDDLPALQCRINAVGDNIFYLWMKLLMNQITFYCLIDNRLCHGMRKMLFQTGCDPEKLIGWLSVKGNHVHYGRLRLCQCSGFVKYYRICLCHCLQKFSALNRNIICTCLADRWQYSQRHGKL